MEFVLAANDDRQLVDASDWATRLLRLERAELRGRRVDDFFVEVNGETVPDALDAFVSDGVWSRICTTVSALGNRKFAYRVRANFAPGTCWGAVRITRAEWIASAAE